MSGFTHSANGSFRLGTLPGDPGYPAGVNERVIHEKFGDPEEQEEEERRKREHDEDKEKERWKERYNRTGRWDS